MGDRAFRERFGGLGGIGWSGFRYSEGDLALDRNLLKGINGGIGLACGKDIKGIDK